MVWMIIFHFFYDLRFFNLIDWDFNSGFWYAFPRVIAFTFLLCVGLSLHYGNIHGLRKEAFIQRSTKLFIAAFTISVVTYVAFPQGWIYFGTLHCILVGSLLGIWFVYHRNLALILMILIMVSQYLLGFDIQWVSANFTKKYSMDFIPIYPWFWAILLGILLAPYLKNLSLLAELRGPKFLGWLGKHSLKIYLLHQPLIFGFLFAFQALKRT